MAENTCSQKGKKENLLVSIHEIRSQELMPQNGNQNFACLLHPRIKGGLECWFILLWQVNMYTVICD